MLRRWAEDGKVRAQAIDTIDSGYPSDTNLLVDACIATVRQAARLDDDAVLPPLPKIAPRRDVVIFTKGETARAARGTAHEIVDVTDIAVLEEDAEDDAAASRASARATKRTKRTKRTTGSRWAVVLCALVAAAFGTAAFLGSPAGQGFAKRHGRAGTAVRQATSSARAHASAAAQATVALFAR